MTSEQKTLTTNKLEYFLPAAFSLSLIISCTIISSKKYFWNDELLSFYLVNDSSFTHMITALGDTINNAPPLYFILAWLWSKVFTSNELSLRLFSSLGICMAQAVVWITLRRTYNFWVTSLGTIVGFGLSEIILSQNAEARFYGLFIAVCSLGLWQFDMFCRNPKYSRNLISTNLFINIAIIQTHLYGFFYSGILIFALIIRDKHFNIYRPRVYLSGFLAWLSFIPWIPAFLRQAELGKPYSWLPVPSLSALINYYLSFPPAYILPILLLISGLIFLTQSSVISETVDSPIYQKDSSSETSLIILALGWLTIPTIAWLISRFLQPIFLERYFIPTQISWSILLAAFISRIAMSGYEVNKSHLITLKSLFDKQKLIIITLIIILIFYPINYAKKLPAQGFPGLKDDTYGYSELPIVVEGSHAFLKRFYYSPNHERYFYPLDWQVALDYLPGDYKTFTALKRNYPEIFEKNVIETKDFLKKYQRFLVLDVPKNSGYKCPYDPKKNCDNLWFESNVQKNRQYKTKKLGLLGNMELFLVEK